jgi:hypothetical protein
MTANDKRHVVSNRALRTMKEVMYEQDHYGMDKYKEPLHHSYNYDWLKMALQEKADEMKYIQNEMDRKEEIIGILKEAEDFTDPFALRAAINHALGLLTAGGREDKGPIATKKAPYSDLDDEY